MNAASGCSGATARVRRNPSNQAGTQAASAKWQLHWQNESPTVFFHDSSDHTQATTTSTIIIMIVLSDYHGHGDHHDATTIMPVTRMIIMPLAVTTQ